MTEHENDFTPEEIEAMQEVADDFAYFGFIDEIAASLEDLTFPQLEQVRDFVYSLYTEGDDCGGCE